LGFPLLWGVGVWDEGNVVIVIKLNIFFILTDNPFSDLVTIEAEILSY
jgi:hypothetical protein